MATDCLLGVSFEEVEDVLINMDSKEILELAGEHMFENITSAVKLEASVEDMAECLPSIEPNITSDDEDGDVFFSCSAVPQGTDLTPPNGCGALFIRSNFHSSLVDMNIIFENAASAEKVTQAIKATEGGFGYDVNVILCLCYHDNDEQVPLNVVGKHRTGEKMQLLATNYKTGYYLSEAVYKFSNTHDASSRPGRGNPGGERPKKMDEKAWKQRVQDDMMQDFNHPVTYRTDEFFTAECDDKSVKLTVKLTGNVTSQWHTQRKKGARATRLFYWRAEIEAPNFHKVAKSCPLVFYANDVNKVNVSAPLAKTEQKMEIDAYVTNGAHRDLWPGTTVT